MKLQVNYFRRVHHFQKWLGVFCAFQAVLFLANPGTTSAAVIVGETTDAGISYDAERNPLYRIEDLGSPDAFIGNRGANNRVVVFVFQLGEDFTAEGREGYGVVGANLKFNIVEEHVAAPDEFNADLMGLRWSASSEVLLTDFSGGTVVQQDIITPSSSLGLVNTDEVGDQALATWLEAQYDAGAVAGNYVFLSLAFDATPALSSFDYYKVDMANNATPGNRPALSMSIAQTVPESSSSVLILVGALIIRWSRNTKTR